MAVLILRLPRAFDSTMQTDSHRTEKLVKEYTARASAYDARWSTYLGRSLLMSLDVISELPAKRVLDVGCGTGQLLEMLAKRPDHPDLFGIDRVPAMLDVARRRIGHRATLLHGDAAKLPFDDAIFQLVASTYALHYFPDADYCRIIGQSTVYRLSRTEPQRRPATLPSQYGRTECMGSGTPPEDL